MKERARRIAALAVVTLAAAGCSRGGIGSFSQLDQNGDGRISREEAQGDPGLIEIFGDVDEDQDGELSAGEYLQAAQQVRG